MGAVALTAPRSFVDFPSGSLLDDAPLDVDIAGQVDGKRALLTFAGCPAEYNPPDGAVAIWRFIKVASRGKVATMRLQGI